MATITLDVCGVIKEKRNKKFALSKAVGELVDNSVDAGSTMVSLTETAGNLIVRDNGKGFSDITSIAKIGFSDKEDQIGRYGVGLKDAAIRYSTETAIRSRNQMMRVPWQDILDGRVEFDAIDDPFKCDFSTGTEITFEGFRRLARSAEISTEGIQRTYAPRLESGLLQIVVNGVSLAALEKPKFTETIDQSFDFRGKPVRVCGGVYPTDDPRRSTWNGYLIYYNGRLIGEKITDQGVDESCTKAFCFFVHLKDGPVDEWVLSTNKDDVEDSSILIEHIFDTYTRPLMVEAGKREHDSSVDDLKSFLEELWKRDGKGESGGVDSGGGSGNIKRRPPSDDPTDKPNPVKPGKSPVNTFTNDGPGAYKTGKASHKKKNLDFNINKLNGTTLAIAEITAKGAVSIEFNTNNAFVELIHSKAKKDPESGQTSFLPLVAMQMSFLNAMGKNDLASTEILNRALEICGNKLHATTNKMKPK